MTHDGMRFRPPCPCGCGTDPCSRGRHDTGYSVLAAFIAVLSLFALAVGIAAAEGLLP